MIDDFVKQPPKKPGGQSPKNKDEDFFPDLSQKPAAPSNTEPAFVTPEQAAAKDAVDETIDLSGEPIEDAPSGDNKPPIKPNKDHWWTRLGAWFKQLNKKQKTLVILAVIVALLGIIAGTYALLSGENPVQQVTNTKPKKKPTTVASNLTGLQVAPEINNKPVTAVMVENSMEARPQAGLLNSGVVFEAIAEGGITRFLALYQDTAPESIGPVRSARPYYIDWALGFDATYAHVGGSPEALQQVKNDNVKDLDQSYNAAAYERVSDRYSPHNVFTSMAKLSALEQSKGYGKSKFTSFPRKKEKASETPTASTINLAISSVRYNVQYAYDKASNSYLRTMGGTPHTDATTSKQIMPKVVIAMVMNYGIASDGKHSVYNTIGNGQVYIFQDGGVTEGTWQKTEKSSQITFTDAAGKLIKLNPGQTWITAINSAASVTYQP
jgi:hypothetical protein